MEPRPYPRLRAVARRLVELTAAPLGTLMRVATQEPAVALTFDDGPHPESTPRLLEILERHGARGTFFMVGKAAAAQPELVTRVAAGEHAVANHSWDHPSMPLLAGRYRRCQLRWCAAALAPHGTRLFRPPYGHQSLTSLAGTRRLGYQVVMGDVVAEDWRDDTAEQLLARIRRRLRPGSIVLLHDALYTTVDSRFADRTPTLEAVDRLLSEEAGRLRFVTVPELLKLGQPRYWHWYLKPDLDWLRRLQ